MAQRHSHSLISRVLRLLQGDSGQALVEAPFVIPLVCIVVLMLVQPVAMLYTKMTLGQIAAGICRIVATEDTTPAGSKERLLIAYSADRLEGLPSGRIFRIPGTLKVDVQGNAQSELITVTVSVKQQPLPLMGFLVGAGRTGQVEVSGSASTRGARLGVEGSPRSAPQSYGSK